MASCPRLLPKSAMKHNRAWGLSCDMSGALSLSINTRQSKVRTYAHYVEFVGRVRIHNFLSVACPRLPSSMSGVKHRGCDGALSSKKVMIRMFENR